MAGKFVLKREAVTDMDGGLRDHPRRAAPMRPGCGMHQERMAQHDIPRPADRVRHRPAQHQYPPGPS